MKKKSLRLHTPCKNISKFHISRAILLIALLTAPLCLTSCFRGELESAPYNLPTAFAQTSEHPTKVSALAELLPDHIKQTGTLIVAAETSFAPLEFIGEDDETVVGFDRDILTALGDVLDVNTEMQTASFDSIIPAVGSRYDLGISGFTISKERAKVVDFIPHFSPGQDFVVQAGNPKSFSENITDDEHTIYEHLCGKVMGVQIGAVSEDEAVGWDSQCKAANEQPIEILHYEKQADINTALIGGKIDIFVADSPVSAYAVRLSRSNGDEPKAELLGKSFALSLMGIVVKKGDSKLYNVIEKALQYLIDQGYYKKIIDYWGVESSAISSVVNAKEQMFGLLNAPNDEDGEKDTESETDGEE